MLPHIDRFKPIFKKLGLELILPEVHERMSEEELLQYAGQFEGVICGDDRFTEKVISACAPDLKIISKWGTGIDSIDQRAAEKFGVQVCRTPNAFTNPVSDSVLGYMLAFARRQPWMNANMKRGEWEKIPGKALHECTLGVIGVGNIGKAVLKKAKAFDMRLLGNDILEIDKQFIDEVGVNMVSLTTLVENSDYISVNCDLNPTSHHLINEKSLEKVKNGSILINTARGPIVDEEALVRSLQSGRLGGAALDVFEVEPLPSSSPLLRMDNVLLAPHNSNSSPTAWENVHYNTMKNLFESLGIPYSDLEEFKDVKG